MVDEAFSKILVAVKDLPAVNYVNMLPSNKLVLSDLPEKLQWDVD